MILRVLGRVAALTLVAGAFLALGAGSALGYAISATAGTLTITPTTEPQNAVVLTITQSGSSVTFSPAAATYPTSCSAIANTTVCPASALAQALNVDSANVLEIKGLVTGTLQITGTSLNNQFLLSSVDLGTLSVDPGGGNDTIDATGAISSMALPNKVSEGGNISIDLQTGATAGTLDLGAGNDYVYAPQSMLNLNGGGGASTLCAGGTINAGGGNDVIHAVSTTQAINGGPGASSLDFLAISTPLTLTMVNGGQSVMIGGQSSAHITNIAQLTGGSGNNTLIAQGPGADILQGGPAANTFIPNGGPDVLEGGSGSNTVDYSQVPASTALTVNLQTGVGGPTGGSSVTQDQLISIGSVIGNDGPDTIIAGPLPGTFQLGNGNDTFQGGSGDDDVIAGNGNDTLTGGSGNDTFTVGNGNDTLIGGSGNNYMRSGTGNDLFEAGWGTNTIIGGGGDDTVSYANRGPSQGVTVTLATNATTTGNGQPGENDSLTGIQNIIGGAGYNILTGDSQNNVITGGPNGNTINGGSGNDTINGGSGNDIINAGSGTTTVNGGGGQDTIDALQGNHDTINCGPGDSTVTVNPTDTTNGHCTTVIDPDLPPPTQKCVHPLPGQNCDGFIEPYPPVSPPVHTSFLVHRGSRYTRVLQLTIDSLPAQTSISLSCRSPALHGCPFGDYVHNFTRAQRSVALARLFHRRQLPSRTRLVLRIVAPEHVGTYILLVTRFGALPSALTRCISPINGKVIACPPGGYLPATGSASAGASGSGSGTTKGGALKSSTSARSGTRRNTRRGAQRRRSRRRDHGRAHNRRAARHRTHKRPAHKRRTHDRRAHKRRSHSHRSQRRRRLGARAAPHSLPKRTFTTRARPAILI